MSIAQFISVMRARWAVMLALLLLTVATAVAVSFVMTKQYSASATILIDAKPDPVAGGMIYGGMLAPSYIATQVDMIQSERVARRVVRTLKLADQPETRERWQEVTRGKGDIEGWLAESLQKRIEVKPSRESHFITVGYTAGDGKFAAEVVNAFVQAYIATTLDLRVDPAKQYSTFFDTRAKQLRTEVEQAQAKLSSFLKSKGLVGGANDERLDVENSRLNELSAQIVALQALSAESGSRQTQARGASGDQMQEVLNNALITTLKADLSRQEAHMQELNARLGDNHPQVIELRANIAELRSRVATETRRVTSGVGLNNTINRSREAEIRASFEAQRAKVLRLKEHRDEAAVLQRDAENAQRAYDGVLNRLNQTNLESQNTQSNVSVLNAATEPSEPSSPKTMRNLMLSIAAGLLLAVGAALALEVTDRRIRAVEDIPTALGLPVLGIMLRPGAARGMLGAVKVPLLQQRLLNSLPGPGRGV